MRLKPESIAEFQALHIKHFGRELTAQEAELEALRLIEFVSSIQPLPGGLVEQ